MRRLEFKASVSPNVVKYKVEWFVNEIAKPSTEVLSTHLLNGFHVGTNSNLGEQPGDVVKVSVKAVNSRGDESLPATAEFSVPVVLPDPPTMVKLT